MKFLVECAARLDAEVPSTEVMSDMRQRFTTLRCLSSKLSIVRSLCRPTPAYQESVSEALATLSDEAVRTRLTSIATHGGRLHASDPEELRAIIKSLPPRLSENARELRLTRNEGRACKRLQVSQMIEKNKVRTVVDGRALLTHARTVVACPEQCIGGIPELTLALMMVTGRRECEILNGRSEFTPHTTHSLVFRGQAKKRDDGIAHVEERIIPCLSESTEVIACLQYLRERQHHVTMSNTIASRRYQSYLSRHMHCVSPWKETKTHVHSLRGIYTCMVHVLFDWELHTDAYVSMCVLGHTSLTESLVYTTFGIGGEFRRTEPHLGQGHLTPPLVRPCDPTPEEEPEENWTGAQQSAFSQDGTLEVPE